MEPLHTCAKCNWEQFCFQSFTNDSKIKKRWICDAMGHGNGHINSEYEIGQIQSDRCEKNVCIGGQFERHMIEEQLFSRCQLCINRIFYELCEILSIVSIFRYQKNKRENSFLVSVQLHLRKTTRASHLSKNEFPMYFCTFRICQRNKNSLKMSFSIQRIFSI